MSSQPDDCDAFEATTSIEEITGDGLNQDTLRSLKNDELSDLWLCQEWEDHGDYVLEGSPGELEWLGHFAMKSTRLESFGILGGDVFHNCSEQSIDRFLFDLRKCNHIKKMHFVRIYLAEIIYKLGGAMKSNNITRLVVEGCCLGVPEATFLFNTLPDVMEELCIDCDDDEEFLSDMLDDDIMAKCILPLAACKGMQKLTLNGLNLSSSSCAALSAVFPRMAALLELNLRGNLIDDDCARVLAQGLSKCTYLQRLSLSRNISDNGFDLLIQGLPTSVDTLDLEGNEIALARKIPLLRFKELVLSNNALCPGGPRIIAASLANPECRLEELKLNRCNIGNEGAATLAESLRNNQRLTRLSLINNNITENGWNSFSSILCNASSINATYNSNHTLQSLGFHPNIPQDVDMMLGLNFDKDKGRVAANKILQVHRHLDMRPFFGSELDLLPRVVAWLERFAESRPNLKLSSIFEFVRAMPMKVTDRLMEGKKHKLSY